MSSPSPSPSHCVWKSYSEKILGWFFRPFVWTNDVNSAGEIRTLGCSIASNERIWGCDKPVVTYFETDCRTGDGKREGEGEDVLRKLAQL